MPEFYTLAGGLEVVAVRKPTYWQEIELHVWSRHGTNQSRVALAQPVVFKEMTPEDEHVSHPPCLTLPISAAQKLMDELWHCGLRPSEGTGSAGALAATQAHLRDMQAIVMHKLGVPKPGGNNR